jgi:hypothetical protein
MRVLIAGVVAGLAMFVWSAIANTATPLGTLGISKSAPEGVILTTLHRVLGEEGALYVLPSVAMSGKAPNGPSAFLVYNGPASDFGITPAKLAGELLVEVAAAIIAAWLLSMTRLSGFAGRVGFVTALGLLAAGMTNASNALWFGFPPAYVLGYAAIQMIGFVIAGVVIAAVAPRPPMASG